MCLDFHPVHNSLLAVGCHDGTVMVFDVRHKANRPIYSSSIKTGKHTDPVWQVGARCVLSSSAFLAVGSSRCRHAARAFGKKVVVAGRATLQPYVESDITVSLQGPQHHFQGFCKPLTQRRACALIVYRFCTTSFAFV